MPAPKPDYLSRDYAGLRESLLQYAAQVYPEWQPSSEGDLGLVLLELFAYQGDILSYYTDRAQFENYLATATQRESVLAQAYLLGYIPNTGFPASGTVRLESSSGVPDTLVPAGTKITTNRVASIDGPVTYETTEDVTVPGDGQNTLVSVVEGTTVSYVKIGESNGYPSQIMTLPDVGIYRDTVRIFVEDNLGTTIFNDGISDIRVREWTMYDHLLDAASEEPAYETQIQGNSMLVIFGDAINGYIPATGIKIFASYRYGYGATGNVAAGEVFLINEQAASGIHVQTDTLGNYFSSQMTGGANAEETDSIRRNAPRAYKIQDRIVSSQDFVNAALNVDGVLKANALAGTFTSVTVFIVGPDGGIPSESLKTAVRNRLSDKTLAGVDVTVASPELVTVNFGAAGQLVTIEVEDRYSQKNVRAAAQRELAKYMAELTFGDRLSVGGVYSVLGSIEGVRTVTIPVMHRSDVAATGTATLTPRPWEVFTLGTFNFELTGGIS